MPDITATYDIDFAAVRAGFQAVEEAGKRASAAVSDGRPAFQAQRKSATLAAKVFATVRTQAQVAQAATSRFGTAASKSLNALNQAGRAGQSITSIATAYSTVTKAVRKTRAAIRLKRAADAAAAKANSAVAKSSKVAAHATRFQGVAAKAASLATKVFSTRVGKVAAISVGAVAGIVAIRKAWQSLSRSKQPNLQVKGPSGAGGLLAGAGKLLGPLAIAGGVAVIGTSIFGAAKEGLTRAISQAATAEQVQIGFEVLTGGPDKAKEVLGEIRTLAESTPLRFADLAGAGRQLLAFKVSAEEIPATLQRIGDISSGVGAPIKEIADLYGKAQVQGTLFAEDINQLTGRGIDVLSEFAAQLGVGTAEVKKMASEGKITFQHLEQAFKSLTGEGGSFAGMMEKQSKTIAGLWSTLTDRISSAYTALGTPINDALRPLLEQAVELAGGLKDRASGFGREIAKAIDFIRASFTQLSGGEIFQVIGKGLQLAFLQAVDVLARGLQAVYAASQDAGFMDGIQNKLEDAVVAFRTGMLDAIGAVLRSLQELPVVGAKLAAAGEELQNTASLERFGNSINGKGPATPVDLLGEIQKHYQQSEGIFGESIEKTGKDLDRMLRPVFAEMANYEAERNAAGEGSGGSAGTGSTGETVSSAAAGPQVAGAFQQAINIITGKSVNQLAVEETKKTNTALDKVVTSNKKIVTAVEKVERALGGRQSVDVKVQPTF